jgi:hypothetical protein
MDILKISDLEKAFNITSQDPFQRVADTIKVALSLFPDLKESFFSKDAKTKKLSIQAIRFVVDKIDGAVASAQAATNLETQDILSAIYQANKLTPVECQLFLQAQALIMQNRNEIFALELMKEEKHHTKTHKKRKPKLKI